MDFVREDNRITELPTKPPGRRGRRKNEDGPAIDDAQFVETLLAMVRREGISGLRMRRVAQVVGVSPKALYRYVNHKQGMLDILVDAILTRNMPVLADVDWEQQLRIIARSFRAAYRPYPGLLAAILAAGASVLGRPYAVRFKASAMSVFERAGVGGAGAHEIFVRFSVLIMGSVLYMESVECSDPPNPDADILDQCFEQNLDMFIADLKRITGVEFKGEKTPPSKASIARSQARVTSEI